jgi:6-phosphofructokinase
MAWPGWWSSAATARSAWRTGSRCSVGFPNTIDNGIVGTTNCFGFDAATTRCR